MTTKKQEYQRPVSIKDIARRARVSVATVSRALHDHPRIGVETRKRVQQLAREMGYVPNETARSLVRQCTYTIGIVMPDASDPYAAAILHSIEDMARTVGYTLLLVHSWGMPARELEAIQTLRKRDVDGLVLVSSRMGGQLHALTNKLGRPLVIVNGNSAPGVGYTVRGDNVHGVILATEYLLHLGHRRIAFIGGPEGSRSGWERKSGYRQVLRNEGLAEAIFPGNGRLIDGVRAFQVMQQQGRLPEAIVCYNDLTALGVLQAAWQAGVGVPENLSVIGFDDILYSAYSIPPLTTVAQPKAAMGEAVVQLLTRLIRGEPAQNILLPGKLIERSSCHAR